MHKLWWHFLAWPLQHVLIACIQRLDCHLFFGNSDKIHVETSRNQQRTQRTSLLTSWYTAESLDYNIFATRRHPWQGRRNGKDMIRSGQQYIGDLSCGCWLADSHVGAGCRLAYMQALCPRYRSGELEMDDRSCLRLWLNWPGTIYSPSLLWFGQHLLAGRETGGGPWTRLITCLPCRGCPLPSLSITGGELTLCDRYNQASTTGRRQPPMAKSSVMFAWIQTLF